VLFRGTVATGGPSDHPARRNLKNSAQIADQIECDALRRRGDANAVD